MELDYTHVLNVMQGLSDISNVFEVRIPIAHLIMKW